MSQEVLIERFIEVLISGDRQAARQIVDECLSADAPAEAIIEKLFWPTLEQIDRMHRQDQLSNICYNFATRMLRMLADQMQMRLQSRDIADRSLLICCGPNEGNELACQMAVDMLEASGFKVFFAGGGIAIDEIKAQVGTLGPDALVMFSSAPADLPPIRELIDYLHDTGVAPQLQIVVGGGVFNRAEGLAEEIGADLWAATPAELVQELIDNAEQRMASDQRTVGRRRRQAKAA